MASASKDRAWLETMLAYGVHLLTQVRDQVDMDEVMATTGPDANPDLFDVDGFLAEVRKFYPEF